MNAKLAPKLISQINNHYIVWFEASNQYLVISDTLKAIIDVYLTSFNQADFITQLHNALNISPTQAKMYYSEISDFLITSNAIAKPILQHPPVALIPEKGSTTYYGFADTTMSIHFGSQAIKNLIHPQFAHATIEKPNAVSCHFDVYKNGDSLYLLKNNAYVGHYAHSDFHLLQGQFAIELINLLYRQHEAEWIGTFHASTVCNTKEAIMIIGDSGNGKSTLSALLMASGMDVLADDFTPLSAINQEVYRFPSGISVKEGAFNVLENLFPEFEQLKIHSSSSKTVNLKYIPPLNDFKTSVAHVPCKKVVYVKYDKTGPSLLQKVNTEQILSTLIPESWLSPLAANAQLFLDWLQDLECFELQYADNDFAVSQFKTLFNAS
ncbi:hypothetical protein [Gelidibacter sp.]|uniref:hypothetical protein n=1 Tax=Gelidibacter sp. TaxID=2018083 RepID=UPI002CF8B343|nr:hypothetical protein [Gelidibacter sp.]HUH29184.1 hypothetical protein [Gelidibacter sp.]